MTTRLSFSKQTLDSAEPDAKALLQAAHAKMGMIPNMYGFMANFPPLLDAYLHGYHLFREKSGFTPVEQEVVFLSISYENDCEYCMAAHSFVADKQSNVPSDVISSLREGTEIKDPRLRSLSALAKAIVQKRGLPHPSDVEPFLDAGYTDNQVLALVLAVGVKTLSNYANHLLDTPPDGVFAGREWTHPSKGS
ncbi:MAG: carboxymuconolactone decarboxylase family protein [Alphaproteobacteria bacterium]|nr:carboxymuconolactone decarboxylase family protein [Alphaproteobacteria bacterium]